MDAVEEAHVGVVAVRVCMGVVSAVPMLLALVVVVGVVGVLLVVPHAVPLPRSHRPRLMIVIGVAEQGAEELAVDHLVRLPRRLMAQRKAF